MLILEHFVLNYSTPPIRINNSQKDQFEIAQIDSAKFADTCLHQSKPNMQTTASITKPTF